MSKVSVFRYNTNGNDELIRQTINNFLTGGNFEYDPEKQAYIRKEKVDKVEMALDIAATAAAAVLGGGVSVNSKYNGSYGFEYMIESGILTIKAYLLNKNGYKDHISRNSFNKSPAERVYCNNLDMNLFQILTNNNVTFIGKEIEKIQDGKKSPTTIALIIVLIMFAAIIAAMLIFLR